MIHVRLVLDSQRRVLYNMAQLSFLNSLYIPLDLMFAWGRIKCRGPDVYCTAREK